MLKLYLNKDSMAINATAIIKNHLNEEYQVVATYGEVDNYDHIIETLKAMVNNENRIHTIHIVGQELNVDETYENVNLYISEFTEDYSSDHKQVRFSLSHKEEE